MAMKKPSSMVNAKILFYPGRFRTILKQSAFLIKKHFVFQRFIVSEAEHHLSGSFKIAREEYLLMAM
jgi:hypothetical protein